MALKIRYERGNIAFLSYTKRCLIFCKHEQWQWKLGIKVERLRYERKINVLNIL